jgi:hypothetical protein
MKKNKKANPHCPVPGCKTTQPHANNPIVKGLIQAFAPPNKMTMWAKTAMGELTHSICRDLDDKKVFAWYSRLRQPEELYFRTLYALFIASEKELHHILSGDIPNSLSGYYEKVNRVVFQGRGLLYASQPGLKFGPFKPIDTLHEGAHASFPAFMACIGFSLHPEWVPPVEKYRKHLDTYYTYLNYMQGMFESGKSKTDVLSAVINMHRPASYWQAQPGGRSEGNKP